MFVGTSAADARTVVNGVAGAQARSVTVERPEGPRALRLAAGKLHHRLRGIRRRSAPTRGGGDARRRQSHDRVRAVLGVRSRRPGRRLAVGNQRRRRHRPSAYPDENCAQATQELGRGNPSHFGSPLTPEVCGRLGAHPLFVLMRRFVPEATLHVGTPWGNNPARTLVYGAAGEPAARPRSTGAGAVLSRDIDQRLHVPRGARRSCRSPCPDADRAPARRWHRLLPSLEQRAAISAPAVESASTRPSRTSRPLREPPVPAYRDPFPQRQVAPAPPDIPLARSVRETLRAKDPGGGPEWALRSWQGLPESARQLWRRLPPEALRLRAGRGGRGRTPARAAHRRAALAIERRREPGSRRRRLQRAERTATLRAARRSRQLRR